MLKPDYYLNTVPWVKDEYLHLSKERDFHRLKAHKENSESA